MNKYFPKMTLLLIGSFVLMLALDSLILNGLLIKWGALIKDELMINRQWWKVITASFLHSGIIHLLLNIVTIYFLGVFIEPKIKGIWFFVAFFMVNVITHIIFSLTWSFDISVGGSSGIYGLIGILVVYCIKDKELFVSNIKNFGMYWLIVYFCVGTLRGLDTLFVHLLGFICGVILGIFINSKNTMTHSVV